MGKSLETNFDDAIARSDVSKNEINRFVRFPRRGGDIQLLYNFLSIDQNVETVSLGVESTRAGESEAQIALAGTKWPHSGQWHRRGLQPPLAGDSGRLRNHALRLQHLAERHSVRCLHH